MILFLVGYITQADSLLANLEQAVDGISLRVNANKIEYTYFNKKGNITLNGGSLKLVDKLIYFWSSVSSTENYISMLLAKSWTAIDRLSIIWKSNMK